MLKAFLKGCLYIGYYRLNGSRVKIGFPFFVYYKVRIYGPGGVRIGKYCSVFPNVFRGLTIVTLSSFAQVIIGDKCDLGGMIIRCRNRIEIGSKTMSANSLVQDTLFVNSNRVKSKIQDNFTPLQDPIKIGKNTWLGSQSLVLFGSCIGDHSVLSRGCLCVNDTVLSYHLTTGNPMLRPMSIEKIDSLFHNPTHHRDVENTK